MAVSLADSVGHVQVEIAGDVRELLGHEALDLDVVEHIAGRGPGEEDDVKPSAVGIGIRVVLDRPLAFSSRSQDNWNVESCDPGDDRFRPGPEIVRSRRRRRDHDVAALDVADRISASNALRQGLRLLADETERRVALAEVLLDWERGAGPVSDEAVAAITGRYDLDSVTAHR